MRRLTNVSTPVAHLVGPGTLRVVNGQLAFATGEEPGALRLDPAGLRAVYCYGGVGVTDRALEVLFAHGVEVAWLTPSGTRCRGRLVRPDTSATTLRLLQHRVLADGVRQLEWAGRVVAAKVESQGQAARHYQRHGAAGAGDVVRQLQEWQRRCEGVTTVGEVRGLEGAASAAWFELLGVLLRPPWAFARRARRPPTDPVNALLSLGYTWVLARAVARCEAAGLEVNLGALHEYRPGRPSLACDLMEPLRVPAVDRWVVGLCNEGRVGPGEFVAGESGGVRLQPGCFGRILHDWETHWNRSGQEEALDGWVARLSAWLREAGGATGPGPEGLAEGEDL